MLLLISSSPVSNPFIVFLICGHKKKAKGERSGEYDRKGADAMNVSPKIQAVRYIIFVSLCARSRSWEFPGHIALSVNNPECLLAHTRDSACLFSIFKYTNYLCHIADCVEFQLQVYFDFSLLQQLQQAEFVGMRYSREKGSRPENKAKNRYKNILPCKSYEIDMFKPVTFMLFDMNL